MLKFRRRGLQALKCCPGGTGSRTVMRASGVWIIIITLKTINQNFVGLYYYINLFYINIWIKILKLKFKLLL